MPKTKNYSLREMIIDKCLSGERWMSCKQIQAAICREMERRGLPPVTSRQTFHQDLLEIENKYNINVVRRKGVGREVLYHYADAQFSIYHREEASFRDYEQLQRLIYGDTFMGMEFFPLFRRAIEERQVVMLDYQKFGSSQRTARRVHPYLLRYYRERLYLLAWSESRERLCVFAFDRMVGARVLEGAAYREPGPEVKDYFRDMVGVTRHEGDRPEEVRLWVSRHQYPYLRTRPIHWSQEVVGEVDDGYLLRLYLIKNYELEQEILQYGEQVRVLNFEL